MQQFIRENGFYKLHQELNEVEENERDNTYKNSQKQIDVILGIGPIL